MLTVLAKLGTPEMVGRFALGLAVTAPVIMFFNLQLRGVQATDARSEYVFGDYLALRLITTVLALVAIAGITICSGYPLETASVILAVATAKGVESLSDVFYGLMQQRERMDRIAQSMMIKGPLSLAALAAGVHMTGQVFWGAVGMAASWALLLILFDIPGGILVLRGHRTARGGSDAPSDRRSIRPRWNPPRLLRLAWLALPLGLVMLLISLNANIPRYFIEHHLGMGELGIFAAMAYLLVAGNTVVGALGQSASPRLAGHYAEGNMEAFRGLLFRIMGMGALLGGVGILVAISGGREFLTLLYTPEFAARSDVFVWLMVVGAVGYVASFLGYGMTAARCFRAQFPLFALVTGGSAMACFWLVPRSGLSGAAWAMLAAALVQLAGSAWVTWRALSELQKGRS
jgi:O-antigen/teichoic acid export membrane protein